MATPTAAEHRDLEARFKKLEKAVAALAAAVTRRPKFEVSAGDLTINGGDLVVDGGDFLLLDTDGSTVFRLGPQELGDRGVSIYRENGTEAFCVRERVAGFGQRVSITADDGTELLSEFQLGSGLRRPFLSMQVHPNAAPSGWGIYGPERSTTSGTFTPLFVVDTRKQNALLHPVLCVKFSDTTTAAEVRLVPEGSTDPLDDFFGPGDWLGTFPAGSTAWAEQEPYLNAPSFHEARVRLEVQVRRTAGAGTVTAAVAHMMGG